MDRKGIISVGNWVIDSVKFIDTYPVKGNLVSITNIEEGLGGCAHNVLVDLGRLKSGLPLYAGGCIGDDKYGKMALDACAEWGIDASNMKILPDESTSFTDVMSESSGTHTRTFFHYRGANAKLGPDQVLSCDVPAKIFHLGYLLLLDELDKDDPEYGIVAARVLSKLLKMGYETSVDVVSEQGDRFRHVMLPCLKYTDYLIVNEVEAGACCNMELRDAQGAIDIDAVKAAAAKMLEEGVRKLCVIHFPEGGVAMSKDGCCEFVPSDTMPLEKIVSAVGAGDAFCAGSLYAIHEGYSLKDLLVFANTCARFNLSSATSTGGAPELSVINDYINKK